jgi:NADH:ubiquinone reductase (non-electrogenic)
MKYDYLVYAVGAEVQTFNILGVKEHAVFMKELHDAERVCAITLVPVIHG